MMQIQVNDRVYLPRKGSTHSGIVVRIDSGIATVKRSDGTRFFCAVGILWKH